MKPSPTRINAGRFFRFASGSGRVAATLLTA